MFQRTDGRWVEEIDLGKNPEGKRLRKTLYGLTPVELEGKVKAFRDAQRTGITLETGTVAQFLDRWLAAVELRGDLRNASLASYKRIIKLHVAPAIGGRPAAELTTLEVDALLGNMKKADKSPRLREMVFITLNAAYRWGVKKKILASNPVEEADRPDVGQSEMKVWTQAEGRTFLASFGDESRWDQVLYELALETGARQGELLGLAWKHVDLTEGTIKIERQLLEERGRGAYFGPPKSDSGFRTLRLSRRLVLILNKYKAASQPPAVEGVDPGETLLFRSEAGTPILRGNLQRYFKASIKRAGVPDIRFHDLRHTNATWLIEAGVDPKTVSERLGHADVSITLDIYVKKTKTTDSRAAEALSEAISGVFA